jgi:circadian clock protein KaiC
MSESQIIESTVGVQKCPTGIVGLDQITEGGLPRGRTTLVCGGPGCGKTVLGMEFLVRGARDYDEPGVFMAFEETTRELTENFGSMQFDTRDCALVSNSTSSRCAWNATISK